MNDKLKITQIQRFCMHDGNGIRTTVFLKGCPLRCAWCHNPETQEYRTQLTFYENKCIACGLCKGCLNKVHTFDGKHLVCYDNCVACGNCVGVCPSGALELSGMEYSIDEILSVVEKDRAFYSNVGGITVSGGEPFSQREGLISLLKKCKKIGLNTAVETCGYADASHILKAIPYTDLFLWDIKDTNNERHIKYTSRSNEKIIENLRLADSQGAKIRLRCILVNGVNTNKEHYISIAEIYGSLKGCEGIELIPYHAYGEAKGKFIGKKINSVPEWIPTSEQIDDAKEVIKSKGALVIN